MSIFINVHAIIFRKSRNRIQRERSFKKISSHAFWVTEKLTTDCVSLYNNACLITKVSVWRPSSGNLCEYPHYHQKLETLAHITCLSSFQFCCGLRKTHLFCNRVRSGHSRSSKVVNFSSNRKGVCNFLLVIFSNFGPIFHRFWYTATYWLKIANFSYLTLI